MEVVRGKRIEKVYIGVACLLVIIFILSFFWPNIITYYKNLKINAATNQIQLATKVGDDIYFYSGYFTDSISLYKYNIKSKKLDRINDIGVSDLKYYDGYVYYVDYENFLYRYDIKKGKSELILSNCSNFQINDSKIVFLNSEEQILYMYDLKTKQITELGINTFKYLLLENKIYYVYDQIKSIMEYDIETKQYKNFSNLKDVDLAELNSLTYYRGKFYLNDYKNNIACYDKEFNFIWKIEGGYNLAIIKDRIYFPNNKDNMNLYSINLKGQDMKKENIDSCFISGELALYKNIDKQLIINIKDKKTYQIPKIEPVVLNTPPTTESKTITGYRMVKKDDKFYYPYIKAIYEKDIKTGNKNLITANNYVGNISALQGNIVIMNPSLKFLDDNTKKYIQITNILINKIITYKDNIYLYSTDNFLYKLDFKTSEIKKVKENKIWLECYCGNKIYYSDMQGDVINRTLLNTFDLETGEKGIIEFSETISKPINEIIYIDDNFILFTSEDGLYQFNNKDKSLKQILDKPIYSNQDIVTIDKGILFLSPENQILYLLDFKTQELKKVVDIFQTEGFIYSFLYDEEKKTLYYLNMPLGEKINEIRLK